MICRAEGLVLRGYRMSESSKVVVLYTREYGKLRLAARGARRPKSKFGASLEPITLGRYVVYRREDRDLQTLSEGDIVHAFDGVKRDYRRTVCGSAICDLVDHVTVEEDPNPSLYVAGLEALRWLESVDPSGIELPLWTFQLEAAAALGYRPQLGRCLRCGDRAPGQRVWFSASEGGLLCRRCGRGGMALNATDASLLEELQAGRAGKMDPGRLSGVNRATVRSALRSYLAYHTETRRTVKALDFMDRMLAAEGAPPPYRAERTGEEVR